MRRNRLRWRAATARLLPPFLAGAAALAFPALASGQSRAASALTAADSALVGRVLLAEDRRDSTDAALAEALAHPDARLQALARRAHGRIRDPRFAARDSLAALAAPLPAPTAWPEAEWRLRMRALTPQRANCEALRAAIGDAHPHVRLRAMDLAGMRPAPRDTSAAARAEAAAAAPPCAGDDALVAPLIAAVDALPAATASRESGRTSWHDAAHAIVALARLRPDSARARLPRFAAHGEWQVRQYAVRAAAALRDTSRLRAFARDAHDNVRETAIESLTALVGHDADAIYLEALDARGVPVVRVAAEALKGSMRPGVAEAAMRAHARLVRANNASSHDTRLALLELAGRTAADDSAVVQQYTLPPDAVALALGADIRLRVTMHARTGGARHFTVRLRGDNAPMMGARILDLVRRGWYHGLAWHRVEPDFVIQGLGPADNEYVGHPQFLRDELGTVPHVRGTVGMSTRGHDTGDGQWFINVRDNLRLGRDYTVWAEVVEGMEVVDSILEGDVVEAIRIVR